MVDLFGLSAGHSCIGLVSGMSHRFKNGEPVIFAKTKYSLRPGPRAKNIDPAEHGDAYSYQVDKFWIVVDQHEGELVLMTRTGKKHTVAVDNPGLRPARWWERLWYHARFPQLQKLPAAAP